jgi:hypothetical protein
MKSNNKFYIFLTSLFHRKRVQGVGLSTVGELTARIPDLDCLVVRRRHEVIREPEI